MWLALGARPGPGPGTKRPVSLDRYLTEAHVPEDAGRRGGLGAQGPRAGGGEPV